MDSIIKQRQYVMSRPYTLAFLTGSIIELQALGIVLADIVGMDNEAAVKPVPASILVMSTLLPPASRCVERDQCSLAGATSSGWPAHGVSYLHSSAAGVCGLCRIQSPQIGQRIAAGRMLPANLPELCHASPGLFWSALRASHRGADGLRCCLVPHCEQKLPFLETLLALSEEGKPNQAVTKTNDTCNKNLLSSRHSAENKSDGLCSREGVPNCIF